MKRGRSPLPEDEQNEIEKRKKKNILDSTHVQTAVPSADSVSTAEVPDWGLWGPYLPERQWGTVREDTSRDGNCWDSLSHDAAVQTAYTSGEDGLLGVCDRDCVMCTSVALWNYTDHILKERLFGLTNPQGNHGEDVKELYYYLDNNPRHSYMRALYKYPVQAFPYQKLVTENSERGLNQPEYEITDTGTFYGNNYWDVYVEYGKVTPQDIVCCVTVVNQSNQTQSLLVAPHVWFRNTWSSKGDKCRQKPHLQFDGDSRVQTESSLGDYTVKFHAESPETQLEEIVFTDNESRPVQQKGDNPLPGFYKDAFHRYIVQDEKTGVNPEQQGTKCAGIYRVTAPPGGERKIYWTIQDSNSMSVSAVSQIKDVIQKRKAETKIFYSKMMKPEWSSEEETVVCQAVAGLLWSKQFYMYNVEEAINKFQNLHQLPGDSPSTAVLSVPRNKHWQHLKNSDIIAVPDKWEFPWYAPWDLAFHMIPYIRIDVEFCKHQLELFLSDRYMRGDGQLPGCEFNLDDPNPPLHAWACLAVYRGDMERDSDFLCYCYNKLLMNYDWWMSCLNSSSLYTGGGFLGMDNISIINRSEMPPGGFTLTQADGTAWVALASLNMLDMALQLVTSDPQCLHQSERFLQNFLNLSVQMNKSCDVGGLWHPQDKFYYDVLSRDDEVIPVRVKSLVGLVAVFASVIIKIPQTVDFRGLTHQLDNLTEQEQQHVHKIADDNYFLSLVPKSRLMDIMTSLCDPNIFWSKFGIRSLAKMYEREPYSLVIDKETYTMTYTPGESVSHMFGGNSNWRGPIWLCMNYLLMESLDRVSDVYGSEFQVELPAGSGQSMSVSGVAAEIARQIVDIFLPNSDGVRPVHGNAGQFYKEPAQHNLLLFYEFFHADSGRGCGASHQTGWTALVPEFLHRKYHR